MDRGRIAQCELIFSEVFDFFKLSIARTSGHTSQCEVFQRRTDNAVYPFDQRDWLNPAVSSPKQFVQNCTGKSAADQRQNDLQGLEEHVLRSRLSYCKRMKTARLFEGQWRSVQDSLPASTVKTARHLS